MFLKYFLPYRYSMIKTYNLDMASQIHTKFNFKLENASVRHIENLVNTVVPEDLVKKFELAPKLAALAENQKFAQKNAESYLLYAKLMWPFWGYCNEFDMDSQKFTEYLANPIVNGVHKKPINKIDRVKKSLLQFLHQVEKVKYFLANFMHTEREAINVQVKS